MGTNSAGWKQCLVVFGLLFPLLAWGGEPTSTLKGTIDQVLAILADGQKSTEQKRENIRRVISQRFDYAAMSRGSLAHNWKKASAAQKQRFIELYARLMQNTYLVLVEKYNNQTVEYGAERIRKGKYAQVNTYIVDAGRKTPVNYKLRLKDGDWQVYDVIIENVSMMNNYRSSYQQIVKTDGMDGLIVRLEEKLTGEAQASN